MYIPWGGLQVFSIITRVDAVLRIVEGYTSVAVSLWESFRGYER